MRVHKAVQFAVLSLALLLLAGACGSDSDSSSSGSSGGSSGSKQTTLRLGYFPNITHATGIAGVESGIFARNLGENVKLEISTFNAGPSAVEALFSEALDATYIGPNPAINAYVRSKGDAIRVITGATSGGGYLIVKPEINSAADLKGKRVATPQLGNTQDVALRSWLKDQGFKTDVQGGGDVSVTPQENAQTLESFRAGQIAGAWVPEPWATRLIQEGGGKVLVDERDLWPGGNYVTTLLIVRTAYLNKHPDVVERLVKGHIEATAYVNANTAESQKLVNGVIEKVTGKPIAEAVITASWKNLKFTNDPVAGSLRKSAEDAAEFGLLQLGDIKLDGIFDLKLLNQALKANGQGEVQVQ